MDYKDLVIWQKAMDLCERTYRITENFPEQEKFRLAAQLRKSAVSVASNIAEGEGRLHRGERRQFLSHARGSLYELETQLLISRRVGYSIGDGVFELLGEERRKLDNYLRYVGNR